jgi:hypothetical protein
MIAKGFPSAKDFHRMSGKSFAIMPDAGPAVLCCAVLCCAVLCCAVLCCAVLCRAGPGRAGPGQVHQIILVAFRALSALRITESE